jgi:esterase/lipase superfamily enzyme
MELVTQLAEAMARSDVERLASLAKQLGVTAPGALGVTPRQLLELQVEVADWLAEREARDQAFRIYTAVLDVLEVARDPDPLFIAQVRDRQAELLLALDLPADAAESWKVSLALTLSIEGDDSEAIQWRMERRAAALEQANDSTTAAKLRQEIDRLRRRARTAHLGQVRSGSEASRDGTAPSRVFELVTVHFGTHRARTGCANPYDFFRGKRNLPMTYGKAVVSVPRDREVGTLPTPPSWVAESRADPARYFIIKSVDVADRAAEFFSDLKGAISVSERKEALVFIHGYNTSFANALLRTAQLAVDLEIDGAAVLYSWPSRGNVLSYLMDRNEVITPLIAEIKDLIGQVAAVTGAKKIHLVAHSIGSEFLLRALEAVDSERKSPVSWFSKRRRPKWAGPSLFSEIVFAAPDVDAMDFAQRVPLITSLGRRVTVYTSSNDVALKWSKWANGEARAGASPAQLASAAVDCVDTSNSAATLFGHDDYVTVAMDDLRAVIWLSLEPRRRRTLREQRGPNGIYWLHDPSALGEGVVNTIREALIWIRRLGTEEARHTIARFIKPPAANTRAARQQEMYLALLHEIDALQSEPIR